MKAPGANYTVLAEHLHPHQMQTLAEYAEARGEDDWSNMPLCCVMAVALAVHNSLPELIAEGLSERKALARVASSLDTDFETLLRQHRRRKRTRPPDK